MKPVLSIALCLLAALPLVAQPPLPRVAAPVSVHVGIAYPPASIIKAKFGISMPAGLSLAEVTAINDSDSALTIGQGEVIQDFAAHGVTVFPRADAVAVITGKQTVTKTALVFRWTYVALQLAGSAVLTGAVPVNQTKQKALAIGLSLGNTAYSLIQAAATPNPSATYDADGMPAIIQIPARSSVVGTVLVKTPATATSASFDIQEGSTLR